MFIFVPAISEEILNLLGKFNDIDLNFWRKNSPYQIPAGLLSAYYIYKRTGEFYKNYKNQNFLELIGFPESYLFIIDSGGYELYSKDSSPEHEELVKILTPQKILSIQEALADIGIILDRVPYQKLPHERFYYDHRFFQEAIEETAKNTEIAIPNRNPASKLKLYGVLQGKTPGHLEQWYNRMKIYEDKLDGWAVSPKSDNTIERLSKVMMYIIFILEKNINKPIHFLGVGSDDALALLIYLSRYFPYLITADSTDYNLGARKRSIIGKSPSQCNCPMTILHNLFKSSIIYGGLALSLHNLYNQIIFIEERTQWINESPENYIEKALAG